MVLLIKAINLFISSIHKLVAPVPYLCAEKTSLWYYFFILQYVYFLAVVFQVLISATEESQAELPPAMDAAIKIFMHINDIEKINCDDTLSGSAPEKCSAKLLVPSAQATHLIGKQGVKIKSIQETTGATVKIIDKGIWSNVLWNLLS